MRSPLPFLLATLFLDAIGIGLVGDYPADTSATRFGVGGADLLIWAEGLRGLREPPEVSPA